MHSIGAWVALSLTGVAAAAASAAVATFEEFGQPPYQLLPESFYNGSDYAGGFQSGGALFNNDFVDFGGGFTAWRGWAGSNMTDVTTPGFGNQYSAYALPGGGGAGSPHYGVAFAFAPGDAYIDLPPGAVPESVMVTNTTYAALSMRDGDAFSDPFGGPSGDEPDYFKLVISGRDASGAPVGAVEFYLADYRFDDNTLDYIVDAWTLVDLTPLAAARRLLISFESSDVGAFGINTPTYAAFDSLVWTPEPGTFIGLLTVAALRRRRG